MAQQFNTTQPRTVAPVRDRVIEAIGPDTDPRLREILSALVTRLHQFADDVSLSIAEWEFAVDFLTRVGQACTDTRQEFVLLSDVLGLSSHIETIGDDDIEGATASTVLGPFHMIDSPERANGDDISPQTPGQRAVVTGTVRGPDGTPISGATIDIWQADQEGYYDVQREDRDNGNGRALLSTTESGQFDFRSVVPAEYPIPTDGPVGEILRATGRHAYRPAHLHFQITAPGFERLTTHVFIGDSPYLDSDTVFAATPDLTVDFPVVEDAEAAARYGVQAPFRQADLEFVLRPE
ncbi:6-chlorohydroxyquinol-1,2-dioxygenase [Epidermidibacterium keratini]|uniref:6-chlorohydroxyquinol-1,2-dioxygenase n=1 Tax=Epidermidibacterium keratini TaxID=1891644 RepID=A0A7L4YMN2_9ACTN|nr:dioxygenase [Epidermidibacterium keratini]QHB99796.1 6-chlorohydroxyquinol-1,2-dioxygenase [Epidermidibacterium keratini]